MSLIRAWDVAMDDYVAAAPTLVNGTVYVGTDASKLHAIDAETGQTEWTFDTDTGHWIRTQPVYDDRLVFAGSELDWDGYVHALDATTGLEGWRHECDNVSGIVVAGGTVYATAGKRVIALDVMDGSERWVYDNTDAEAGYFGSPVVADDVVCAVSEEGRIYGLDAATGDGRWTLTAGGYVASGSNHPVARDGTIYVGDQETLHALDPETGRGQWSVSVDRGADAPAIGTDRVYLAGSEDVTAVDVTDGGVEWRTPLNAELGRPAVGPRGVYVGSTSGTLYELDPDDGQHRSTLDLGGDQLTKPAVGTRTLFVGSADHTLYAVEFDASEPSPETGEAPPEGFRQRAADRGDSDTEQRRERSVSGAGCPNCGREIVPEPRSLQAEERSCEAWVCPQCETILGVRG